MSRRVALPDDARSLLSRWYGADVMDATRLLQGSIAGWLFGRLGQHAVTLRGTVHFTTRAPRVGSPEWTALLGHELFHVVQQRKTGWWRFLAGYARRWRPAHLRRGWLHPYEAPAYARGREVRSALEP